MNWTGIPPTESLLVSLSISIIAIYHYIKQFLRTDAIKEEVQLTKTMRKSTKK